MIDSRPMSTYANVKGGIAPIPLKYHEMVKDVIMSNMNCQSMSVNGKVYYSNYLVLQLQRK